MTDVCAMPPLYRVLANAEHVDEIKQQIAGSLDDTAGKFLRHELGPIRDMRTAVAEENVRVDNDSRGATSLTSWPLETLIFTALCLRQSIWTAWAGCICSALSCLPRSSSWAMLLISQRAEASPAVWA